MSAGANRRESFDGSLATASDHSLAVSLAARAGDLLLALQSERGFADPQELRDQGDRRAQVFLAAELAANRPLDAVLSEEAPDDLARLTADRLWIIDPLDGTREFGEQGRTDWAVHVALWSRGVLIAGAVALPAAGAVYATMEPPVVPEIAGRPVQLVVSRTRPPAVVERIAAELGGELVAMGSAGAKAMAVVTGQADAYIHSGGQYEWDSAAPVAVALSAGLHASRIDGSPLRYNGSDAKLPDLVICRRELAGELMALLARKLR